MKKQRMCYSVLVLCVIASAVQLEPGEMVTTDQVPEATLKELSQGDTPKVAYLRTEEFDPEAGEGGEWVTIPDAAPAASSEAAAEGGAGEAPGTPKKRGGGSGTDSGS